LLESIYMRLWSLNPKYLDRVGLLAAWRESLLAKKVLLGKTKGYKNHPQLERFKNSQSPVKAINNYLWGLYNEAKSRQYNFKLSKIGPRLLISTLETLSNHLGRRFKSKSKV